MADVLYVVPKGTKPPSGDKNFKGADGKVHVGERSLGERVDCAAAPVGGAHAHDFTDRERKHHMRRLRQHRALQG